MKKKIVNDLRLNDNNKDIIKWIKKCDWYDGEKYFDILKALRYNGGMTIVNGIRDVGKTFAYVCLAIQDYIDNGNVSIFSINSKEFLPKFRKLLTKKVKLFYPHLFNNIEECAEGYRDSISKEMVIYITATLDLVKYKGGRINIKRIIIDEFNRYRTHWTTGSYTETLDNLLITFGLAVDNFELILLSNSLSITDEVYIKYKIFKINNGETYIPIDKTGFYIKVLSYKKTVEQLDKRYSDKWVYALTKYTGSFNHNFKNEMLEDNLNKVGELEINENFIHLRTLVYDNNYFRLYKLEYNIYNKEKNIYYIHHLKNVHICNDENIAPLTRKDNANSSNIKGLTFNKTLLELMVSGNVLFSNMYCKKIMYLCIY